MKTVQVYNRFYAADLPLSGKQMKRLRPEEVSDEEADAAVATGLFFIVSVGEPDKVAESSGDAAVDEKGKSTETPKQKKRTDGLKAALKK